MTFREAFSLPQSRQALMASHRLPGSHKRFVRPTLVRCRRCATGPTGSQSRLPRLQRRQRTPRPKHYILHATTYAMLEHSPAINHSQPAERLVSLALNTHRPPATRPTSGNSSAAVKIAHLCCPENRYRPFVPRRSTNGTPQYAQIRFIDAFSFPHSSQTTRAPVRDPRPLDRSSPPWPCTRGAERERRPHLDPVGRRPRAL